MPMIVPEIGSVSKDPKQFWNNFLVGKQIADGGKTDVNSVIAKKDLPGNARVIQEGGMATMDHQEGRMNVHVDKDGKVNKITYG